MNPLNSDQNSTIGCRSANNSVMLVLSSLSLPIFLNGLVIGGLIGAIIANQELRPSPHQSTRSKRQISPTEPVSQSTCGSTHIVQEFVVRCSADTLPAILLNPCPITSTIGHCQDSETQSSRALALQLHRLAPSEREGVGTNCSCAVNKAKAEAYRIEVKQNAPESLLRSRQRGAVDRTFKN